MGLEGDLSLGRVRAVEQFALHAWPALEVVSLDGWWVRYAAGVTRRANSVWPNVLHGAPDVDVLMGRVEDFYHALGEPARYQVCPAMLPDDLDERLSRRGYRATARTAVQTSTLDAILGQPVEAREWSVEIAEQPSMTWWDCYMEAEDVASDSVEVRRAICSQIEVATAYATLRRGGKAIAVGSAAVETGWVGFFNIATLPDFRRQGAARALMHALGQWGRAQGATRAYLQVMAENVAALRLYAPFGFTTGYFYHYREESST